MLVVDLTLLCSLRTPRNGWLYGALPMPEVFGLPCTFCNGKASVKPARIQRLWLREFYLGLPASILLTYQSGHNWSPVSPVHLGLLCAMRFAPTFKSIKDNTARQILKHVSSIAGVKGLWRILVPRIGRQTRNNPRRSSIALVGARHPDRQFSICALTTRNNTNVQLYSWPCALKYASSTLILWAIYDCPCIIVKAF